MGCNTSGNYAYPIIIGAVHLVLACWGLGETIQELFYEQEPVEMNTVLYIAFHFLFQVFLVISLIFGTIKNIAPLLLPWLLSTALLFSLATVYAVFQVTKERYFKNNFQNFAMAIVFWVTWWIVCRSYTRINYQHNGQYEKLPTSELNVKD